MIKRIIAALFLVLVVTQLALAGTSCNDFWGMDETCITVHPDLHLGTIDSSLYHDPTPQGGGSLAALESLSNGVTVVRASRFAMTWTLEVQVVSASPVVDLTKFAWRGGDQRIYTTFPAVGVWMQVSSGRSVDSTDTFSIDYRYQPTVNDPPGDYELTLRYRVNLFWWSVYANPVYSVHHDVTLNWETHTWLVLAVHDSLNLGTIDGSLYDMDHGFSSLESQGNGLFIVTNAPSGWELQLGVASITTPPAFAGDLLADLYWRTDEGAYHTASGLDTAPVLIESQPTAGRATHSVSYRYQVDTGDIPGDYAIRLRYTAVAK